MEEAFFKRFSQRRHRGLNPPARLTSSQSRSITFRRSPMAASVHRSTRRPKAAASRGRGQTVRARSGRSRSTKAIPKRREPSSAALTVFGLLQDGLARFGKLQQEMQSVFDASARNPPGTTSTQRKFANTLAGWAATARRLVSKMQAATEAGADLPELSACDPHESDAKQVLAGLEVLGFRKFLEELADELQRLANRARQPLTPDESRRLWDEFANFIARLAAEAAEMRDLLRLVEAARQRCREARARLRKESLSLRLSSSGEVASNEVQAAASGELALGALDKVSRLIKTLYDAFSTSRLDLVAAGNAIDSTLDDMRSALQRYDYQVADFCAVLDDDPDCREVLADDRGVLMHAISPRLMALRGRLEEETEWCRVWLQVICKREAVTYTIPASMVDRVSKMVRKLDAIGQKLQKVGGYKPRAEVDMTGVRAEAAGVLRLMLDDPSPPDQGHTVRALATLSGLGEQKVRRMLVNELGEEGLGIVMVSKGDRGRGEGKHKYSPPDTYSIAPEYREHVRAFLQSS